MKFRFKPTSMERAVGLFIFGAIGVFVLVLITIAIKQSWFQSTIDYNVYYEEGDGLHVGTAVMVAGIKAGSVSSVEIGDDNRIHVVLHVKEKFARRIRQDSVASIARPLMIGEKQINISMGDAKLSEVAHGGILKGEGSTEITDLMSGKNLKPYLATVESLFGYMTALVAELNKSDQKFDIVGIYREILPTLRIAQDAFKKVPNMSEDFTAIRKGFFFTPEMKQFITQTSRAGRDLAALSSALAEVSPEMKSAIRDMSKVSPEFVRIAQQSTDTLGELLIVLKAFQKSWFLNSHVEDVKKEMEKRAPASPRPSGPQP